MPKQDPHEEESREMTVAEAGRKGGQTVKQRYGSDFYGEIGKKGGSTTKKRYGPDHYADIGRRGGQTTAERHGQEFYENIGRKGGQRQEVGGPGAAVALDDDDGHRHALRIA